MNSASWSFSVTMTQAMADIMAASVPGRMGIHSSARDTALRVIRGSMQTTRAPFSRAFWTKNSVLVPSRISAGFQPHIRMYFEFSQSWRWLPVTPVP
jgi:hypothetical protein